MIFAQLVAKLYYFLIWSFELVNVYLSILLNLILFLWKTDKMDNCQHWAHWTTLHSPLPLPASWGAPSSLHVPSQSGPESEPSCLASEVWRLVCLRLSCRWCLHSSSEQRPGLVFSFTKVSRWGNGWELNVSFMSQTFQFDAAVFTPELWMKQLLLIAGKYFAIEWKNCTFAFYVDIQSRRICQFLYKGGIMSHKAANLESDSTPWGSEPR